MGQGAGGTEPRDVSRSLTRPLDGRTWHVTQELLCRRRHGTARNHPSCCPVFPLPSGLRPLARNWAHMRPESYPCFAVVGGRMYGFTVLVPVQSPAPSHSGNRAGPGNQGHGVWSCRGCGSSSKTKGAIRGVSCSRLTHTHRKLRVVAGIEAGREAKAHNCGCSSGRGGAIARHE